jgi:Domain of unknown function (DUF222)
MFDSLLPESVALHSVDDATLIGAIEGWARRSAAADARRLAAIAELARRRCDDDTDERALWVCDTWDSAAAEVAAAMNIGHGRALGQLTLAETLRDRLPRINALFMAGSITLKLVTTLRFRTMLVNDEVLDQVDAALAKDAISWGPFSDHKLEQKIDLLIERHDPAALKRLQSAARQRDINIGDREDETGTTSIWGRLLATDAAALKKRLTAMAHSVCKGDPRTMGQLRADALGALGVGSEHLACLCGGPQCPANPADGRAANVVIHIVADQTALTAQPDPALHGDDTPPAPVKVTKPGELRRPGAGVILGGAIVPAPLLAELIRGGAKVQFVGWPSADPESRYRPSAKLAEFVRIRDLTCRFPGCDRPAEYADVDHTLPWPDGTTHPSDLKCFCRKHHNLKTFWIGNDGWADQQRPDGTVIVATPAGKIYTTKPGSALLFPGWNITTTTSPPTGKPPPTSGPLGDTMPKRKRTRIQDRAYRIAAERALNAALIAESQDPPPF